MKIAGKVGTKGEITIPARLRAKRGFRPGTEVVFKSTKRGILIRVKADLAIEELCGILKDKSLPDSIEKDPDREFE
jgi:AbrB family looped-hinge helix DNA binding protein